MKVLFLDIDGTMTDINYIKYILNHWDEVKDKTTFPLEDKFKTLAEITKKYDLKVVLSGSVKLDAYWEDFDENDNLVKHEHPDLTELKELLNKYGIEFYGMTPSIPNPKFPWGQRMWKDYDIQTYLIEHPEVTEYVILDDVYENDINMLKNHLVKTEWDEDGLGNGGLLPHHIDEVKDKLLPTEEIVPEYMEKNKLYKQIKYSGYNVVDYGKYGLVMKFDDVTLHVSLSFDKSVVFFHWYDEYEERRGTFKTYEEFLDILYYIGVIKDEERDQEAKKLERRA